VRETDRVNPSTALGTVLVDELVRGGVRHVVLCPGSRSAPLAFALHAADQAGRLTLHVRVDERGAAFLALGLAKASGPVAVVTTSGTAVANLHPALLEASHGGVPVLAVTADRPPELRGTGANQTTDQVGIFGGAVRAAYDLGTPDERPGQAATWRSTVCRALAAATGARGSAPGPVHLNVPLREPLVPDVVPAADGGEPMDGRPDGLPWVQVALRSLVSPAPDLGPRTLVLVGDLPRALSGDVPDWGALAARLASAHGWPLVAEPTAGAARAAGVPAGSLLLTCADWVDRHRPDTVLVVGRVTLARSAAALLRHPGTAVELVTDDVVWPDPAHRARRVHPLVCLLPAQDDATAAPATDPSWAADWQAAGERVAVAAGELVEATWPSGAAVAAAVTAALPPEAVVFAGSSNGVRDLDLAGGAGGPLVLANRGLAGIDGCLSTAAGLALAGGRPTYALVGDLTFVHDLTSLVVGPDEPQPDLTVVVVNDDGGGIFTLLEPGAPEHAGAFERVFGTPHATDLAQVCAATSTAYVRAGSRAELVAALQRPPKGTTVVEVRLQRSAHRGAAERLRGVAAAAAG
jgi:2-succinyl-5-enolpyruvyl-6-hydroxy-3-cyclohexene-1-carboxylate synthase